MGLTNKQYMQFNQNKLPIVDSHQPETNFFIVDWSEEVKLDSNKLGLRTQVLTFV